MKNRRSVLCGVVTVSVGVSTGCLDTFSGGSFVGGADPTQLTAKRGEIVRLYDEAIAERNDGIRTRDDAIQTFNDGEYGRAIEKFEETTEYFGEAEAGFAEAASQAKELGEEEAAAICGNAEENAKLQIAATRAGLNAAKAANGQGTAADVNEYVREYQNLVEQSQEIAVEDPQTLAEVIESA